MEQEPPVTHVELLVQLRLMQQELKTIRDAINNVTSGHDKEIEEIKGELKTLKSENEGLKIRMGQVMAISAVLTLVIPFAVTAASPRLEFGQPIERTK
jgi:hypothetical protein